MKQEEQQTEFNFFTKPQKPASPKELLVMSAAIMNILLAGVFIGRLIVVPIQSPTPQVQVITQEVPTVHEVDGSISREDLTDLKYQMVIQVLNLRNALAKNEINKADYDLEIKKLRMQYREIKDVEHENN